MGVATPSPSECLMWRKLQIKEGARWRPESSTSVTKSNKTTNSNNRKWTPPGHLKQITVIFKSPTVDVASCPMITDASIASLTQKLNEVGSLPVTEGQQVQISGLFRKVREYNIFHPNA